MVWNNRGKKIYACISENRGTYYYLGNTDSITLKVNPNFQLDEFYNESSTGHWQLNSTNSESINGIWEDENKKIKLPINLNLIEKKSDKDPCGSMAYLDQQLNHIILERDKITEIFGHKYRHVHVKKKGVNSIEVIGEEKRIKNLNQSILVHVLEEIHNATECQSYGDPRDNPGMYFSDVTPVFWNNQLLSVKLIEQVECTSYVTVTTSSAQTYDTTTGSEIDLWNWFDQSDESLSALHSIIVGHAKGEADPACLRVLTENPSNVVWASQGGLTFYTQLPRVSAACSEEIFVSFAELMPFLSQEGKKRVTILQHN